MKVDFNRFLVNHISISWDIHHSLNLRYYYPGESAYIIFIINKVRQNYGWVHILPIHLYTCIGFLKYLWLFNSQYLLFTDKHTQSFTECDYFISLLIFSIF